MSKTLLIGIILLLLVVFRLRREIIAVLALRFLAKTAGDKAIAKQPDEIHLAPVSFGPTPGMAAIAAQLAARGFAEAGTWSIAELSGVKVQFLLDAPHAVYACVYEHPQAGCWAELVTRYQDQSGATFTTRPPTGLSPRPGDYVEHAPGVALETLCERMLRERPQKPMLTLDAAKLPQLFEAAWAQQIAWKKQHGTSPREMARFLVNRRAKSVAISQSSQ